MDSRDIEQCIKAIKKGDTNAFERLIDAYQRPIYKYIKYITYSEVDLDDIVQEVFIRIYMNLSRYKQGTNFEGWIYKIAYNQTMTILKKKAKEPNVIRIRKS